MPAKTVSAHILEALRRIEEVETLGTTHRVHAIGEMYRVFKRMQGGATIVAPLYPDTDKVTTTFEAYRKTVTPSDILDDPPGPFQFDWI